MTNKMDFDINSLTLIDLISERHAQLRKKLEKRWNAQSEVQFSHTEWYLLAKIYQKSISISQAAFIVGISRQAMQKCVKKLEDQGIVTTSFQNGNQRDKFLQLTKTGTEYCIQNNQLKVNFEQELVQKLGESEVDQLKDLFKKEW